MWPSIAFGPWALTNGVCAERSEGPLGPRRAPRELLGIQRYRGLSVGSGRRFKRARTGTCRLAAFLTVPFIGERPSAWNPPNRFRRFNSGMSWGQGHCRPLLLPPNGIQGVVALVTPGHVGFPSFSMPVSAAWILHCYSLKRPVRLTSISPSFPMLLLACSSSSTQSLVSFLSFLFPFFSFLFYLALSTLVFLMLIWKRPPSAR